MLNSASIPAWVYVVANTFLGLLPLVVIALSIVSFRSCSKLGKSTTGHAPCRPHRRVRLILTVVVFFVISISPVKYGRWNELEHPLLAAWWNVFARSLGVWNSHYFLGWESFLNLSYWTVYYILVSIGAGWLLARLAAQKMKMTRKQVVWTVATVTIAYFATYVSLSSHGTYSPTGVNHKLDDKSALEPERVIWTAGIYPDYWHRYYSRPSCIPGFVFRPLWEIDIRLWHVAQPQEWTCPKCGILLYDRASNDRGYSGHESYKNSFGRRYSGRRYVKVCPKCLTLLVKRYYSIAQPSPPRWKIADAYEHAAWDAHNKWRRNAFAVEPDGEGRK